jgi:hypothetical protein
MVGMFTGESVFFCHCLLFSHVSIIVNRKTVSLFVNPFVPADSKYLLLEIP